MKIRGANLVDRFYTLDGWTREKVAELVIALNDDVPIFYVILRYYEFEKDKAIWKNVYT